MEEVKRAYRDKILQHHPDRGGNKEVAQRINEAYEQAQQLLAQRQVPPQHSHNPLYSEPPARSEWGQSQQPVPPQYYNPSQPHYQQGYRPQQAWRPEPPARSEWGQPQPQQPAQAFFHRAGSSSETEKAGCYEFSQ